MVKGTHTSLVRVFIFLLSGLFCCLGFFGCIFFAVWAGACFFCCLGRGAGPAQTAKKNTPPPKQQKHKHAPAPSERFFCFLLFGRVGVFVFLLFGRLACFCCCLGGGRVFFFAAWAMSFFFFAVWAGGVFIFFAVWCVRVCVCVCVCVWVCVCVCFLLFGRGTGVHSLTGLPGSSSSDLQQERPNSKKKTGSDLFKGSVNPIRQISYTLEP